MTSSWAYVWLFCIFLKELTLNVPGNPSFIFTAYKQSGLDGCTPSPKWVHLATYTLPLPKRETDGPTVYTSLIQTASGTHLLLAVGLSKVFFSVHQPFSSLDEGC